MGCISSQKVKKVSLEEEGFLRFESNEFISGKTENISKVYTLGEIVGEGSYGKVYSAIHSVSKQERAIKVIKRSSIVEEKARDKVLNEVEIMKKLDHPNCLKLYEFFKDKTHFYLVTDLCTGGELLDVILGKERFNEEDVIYYFKQIIAAVTYLHSIGVVHRDLKLENLLLESNSPRSILKVIDFGSAASLNHNLTKKKGTLLYLAPEVLSGKYDEKCDIWSCGIILYILLSGRMPFGGSNEKEITNCIKNAPINMDTPEWVGRSEKSKKLVKQLLNRNPKKRPSATKVRENIWLNQEDFSPIPYQFFEEAMGNLVQFRASSKLQRAVLCYMASQQLTQSDQEELSRIFTSLDSNGNGKLTVQDLYKGCQKVFGETYSLEAVKYMVAHIDTDQNGYIDYSEFIIASIDKEKLLSKERLESTFEAFDETRNGVITADELRMMLEQEEGADLNVWTSLIQEVDQNGDGEVDLREFKEMMLAKLD